MGLSPDKVDITTDDIFDIKTGSGFEERALQLFNFQFENNAVYRSFCDLTNRHPADVKTVADIPFLPITFFKSHRVVSGPRKYQAVFRSSGTTGAGRSKHYVADMSVYERSYLRGFQKFYGRPEEYAILALLPSYIERGDASLVHMVNGLIERSNNPHSGFYLDNTDELAERLSRLDSEGHKILLIGVTFALLDLVEKHTFHLKNTVVMETGGMKGRRREMVRAELHDRLKKGLGVEAVHSEYGMTELLSQAYSKGEGLFRCPPWMRVQAREPEDALSPVVGGTGGLNIIDLANVNSCAFIATQDLGRVYKDGFEVLGRFDHSDVRGCSLMTV